jgi:rubredoxin
MSQWECVTCSWLYNEAKAVLARKLCWAHAGTIFQIMGPAPSVVWAKRALT